MPNEKLISLGDIQPRYTPVEYENLKRIYGERLTSPEATAATEVCNSSPVHRLIDELDTVLVDQGEFILALSARLAVVLVPEACGNSGEGCQEAKSMSPLVADLCRIAAKVRDNTDVIKMLLRRVEC